MKPTYYTYVIHSYNHHYILQSYLMKKIFGYFMIHKNNLNKGYFTFQIGFYTVHNVLETHLFCDTYLHVNRILRT